MGVISTSDQDRVTNIGLILLPEITKEQQINNETGNIFEITNILEVFKNEKSWK